MMDELDFWGLRRGNSIDDENTIPRPEKDFLQKEYRIEHAVFMLHRRMRVFKQSWHPVRNNEFDNKVWRRGRA